MKPAPTLIDRIADLYASEPTACDGMLAAAAGELRQLRDGAPIVEHACRLPVCRHLPAVIDAAGQGSLASIARSFAEIEPRCRWRQNPNYTRQTIGDAFLDDYGYVELVGRGCRWPSATMAVGFLMLGPGTHYPPHQHPAAEVYHVVAGDAAWGSGGSALVPRAAGAAIYHAPNVVHETQTRTAPLLALYCWRGAIAMAAKLT